MVVGIWLEIKAASDSSECILASGDNTSAIGWLFQSGRVDQKSLSYAAIQQVARHLATLILNSDNCLASQHIKGKKNIVADLLSYTGSTRGHAHPLETVLTQWLQALCGMPQAIWLRRSGNVTGSAPCTSRAATTCSPTSAPYSRRTTMSTLP
jgi:hypothetical protein